MFVKAFKATIGVIFAIAFVKIAIILLAVLSVQAANASPKATHAQLSSLYTVKAPDHGQPIELETVDSIHNVGHDRNNPTQVVISQAGTYLVIASPQVALTQDSKTGCIDIWIRINESDVANTSVTKCWSSSKRANKTDVLVLQAVLNLNKGDSMQVFMRSIPHKSAEILAINNDGAPFTPSIIYTLIKQ